MTPVACPSAPRAAVCIAGAARAFTSPLVLDGLRHNFLAPIAGDRLEGVRLFLHLKVADSSKRMKGVAFQQHRSRVAPLYAELMAHPWLSPLVEEAVIVNGSGAFTEGGTAPSSRVTVVSANESAWKSFMPRACSAHASSSNAHGSRDSARDGTRSCCRKASYLLEGNNEERLIHQHLGMSWCINAILRSEARRRVGYELLVFTRPDLVWWRPLPMTCELATLARTTMLSCDLPGCDMVWIAPRKYMERLLGQAKMHRDCADSGPPPHGAARARNVRRVASCCSTSEWLLWYAQSYRASNAASKNTSKYVEGGELGLGEIEGEIPIKRLRELEPDRGGAFSLLREANGACELALAPNYLKDRYRLQQWHGLSVATGTRLRQRFLASSAATEGEGSKGGVGSSSSGRAGSGGGGGGSGGGGGGGGGGGVGGGSGAGGGVGGGVGVGNVYTNMSACHRALLESPAGSWARVVGNASTEWLTSGELVEGAKPASFRVPANVRIISSRWRERRLSLPNTSST